MNKWKNLTTGEIREADASPGEGWVAYTPTMEVTDRLGDIERTGTEKIEALQKVLDERTADFERRLAAAGKTKTAETEGQKPISIQKLARSIATGDWRGAEYEREVAHPSERTAQTSGSDALGGYIVPPEYLPQEFVDYIYTEVNFINAGARVLNLTGGHPIVIPTQEGSATAYWVAENAAITESNLTFGQKTAVPHALAGLTKTSNRVLRDSNPSIETLIRQSLGNTLAVELDRALIYGLGASGQPLGLTRTTGINTTAAGAGMGLDNAWAMLDTIEVDNAIKGPLTWLLKYEQWHDLRKAADAAGQPKYTTGAGAVITKEAYGIPVLLDGNLTDGDAILGCFNQALVCQWGGMEFMASQHADTAFAADQTWIRAVMDVDLVVLQPLSFCFDTSFT